MKFVLPLLLFLSCTQHEQRTEAVKTDTLHSDPVLTDTLEVTADTIVPFRTDTVRFSYDTIPVSLSNGISFTLKVIKGYRITVVAEGLGRLRFLAKSPDGRLFATDMYDRSDNRKGRVLVFEDRDSASGKFRAIKEYLSGLHNPNQVEFFGGHVYIAETGRLSRYVYHKDSAGPASGAQVIARFPDYGLGYKYGGWHLTRSIAFHNNKLYVSVGSSCNACVEAEEVRAVILEMDPDGRNVTTYAKGLRNSVGIGWINNQLWATGMGRDLIGPDKPEDLFQRIDRGEHYGWPYYFQYAGRIYPDPEFKDSLTPPNADRPPLALTGFKAHSAPLGYEHMKGFSDPSLKNSVLVCLHGSTSVWRQRGNAVVRISKGNYYTEIVSGFLKGKTEEERHGRPCDILMNDENSFYFTDDKNGVLYYVYKN